LAQANILHALPTRSRYYDHNFGKFDQFSANKLAIFLKTNVIINFWHKIAVHILSKNSHFLFKVFRRKYFKNQCIDPSSIYIQGNPPHVYFWINDWFIPLKLMTFVRYVAGPFPEFLCSMSLILQVPILQHELTLIQGRRWPRGAKLFPLGKHSTLPSHSSLFRRTEERAYIGSSPLGAKVYPLGPTSSVGVTFGP
jgi:hypothetical protein